MFGNKFNLSFSLRMAHSELTQGIARYTSEIQRMRRANSMLASHASMHERQYRAAAAATRAELARDIITVAGLATAFAGLYQGIQPLIKAHQQFQYQSQALTALMGSNKGAADKLYESFRRLNPTIREFSGVKVLTAMRQLVQAGYTGQEAARNVGAVLNFVTASFERLNISEAVDLAVSLDRAFGGMTVTFSSALDAAQAAANSFTMSTSDIGQAMGYATEAATQYNQSLDSVLITMGLLKPVVKSASKVGTVFRGALMNLVKEENIEFLKKYGVAVKDHNGNIREALDIYLDIAKVMDDIEKKDKSKLGFARQKFEKQIGGVRGGGMFTAIKRATSNFTPTGKYAGLTFKDPGDVIFAYRQMMASNVAANEKLAMYMRDSSKLIAETRDVAFEDLAAKVGGLFAEPVDSLNRSFTDFANWMSKFIDSNELVASGLSGLLTFISRTGLATLGILGLGKGAMIGINAFNSWRKGGTVGTASSFANREDINKLHPQIAGRFVTAAQAKAAAAQARYDAAVLNPPKGAVGTAYLDPHRAALLAAQKRVAGVQSVTAMSPAELQRLAADPLADAKARTLANRLLSDSDAKIAHESMGLRDKFNPKGLQEVKLDKTTLASMQKTLTPALTMQAEGYQAQGLKKMTADRLFQAALRGRASISVGASGEILSTYKPTVMERMSQQWQNNKSAMITGGLMALASVGNLFHETVRMFHDAARTLYNYSDAVAGKEGTIQVRKAQEAIGFAFKYMTSKEGLTEPEFAKIGARGLQTQVTTAVQLLQQGMNPSEAFARLVATERADLARRFPGLTDEQLAEIRANFDVAAEAGKDATLNQFYTPWYEARVKSAGNETDPRKVASIDKLRADALYQFGRPEADPKFNRRAPDALWGARRDFLHQLEADLLLAGKTPAEAKAGIDKVVALMGSTDETFRAVTPEADLQRILHRAGVIDLTQFIDVSRSGRAFATASGEMSGLNGTVWETWKDALGFTDPDSARGRYLKELLEIWRYEQTNVREGAFAIPNEMRGADGRPSLIPSSQSVLKSSLSGEDTLAEYNKRQEIVAQRLASEERLRLSNEELAKVLRSLSATFAAVAGTPLKVNLTPNDQNAGMN